MPGINGLLDCVRLEIGYARWQKTHPPSVTRAAFILFLARWGLDNARLWGGELACPTRLGEYSK